MRRGRVRTERDYYAILGVPPTAGEEEIKRAYRKLALQHHPDRNPGDRRAEERFKEISEAYAVLIDPERRREYDALRRARAAGDRAREPRWREEDLFRDLFRDPRAASVFEDLVREWGRMGLRVNEAFFRDLFFRGQGVIIVGIGGIRWVGPFGPRVGAEPVEGPGAPSRPARGAEPSLPGFLGWLWGRVQETLAAPLRGLGQVLALPRAGAGGGDLNYQIALDPEALRRGGRYRLTIERAGRTEELLVRVPPGLREGTRLRLRGKGEPGPDGRPGDLFLHVRRRG